ncbi:hypothetical protein SKAU_G00230730 [Synaphobranchus kaupii]|uniref:Uncharacterized protein n=1 Tax=Synaphobranchus kaupii TaxID=118154 RepID=A0A9Q1ISY6_SYNKA|nr:hypothetical protein SKAU_G00230730 [Synaphobranchus kaupii]
MLSFPKEPGTPVSLAQLHELRLGLTAHRCHRNDGALSTAQALVLLSEKTGHETSPIAFAKWRRRPPSAPM